MKPEKKAEANSKKGRKKDASEEVDLTADADDAEESAASAPEGFGGVEYSA